MKSVAGSHLCPLIASPPQIAIATELKPAAGVKGPYMGFSFAKNPKTSCHSFQYSRLIHLQRLKTCLSEVIFHSDITSGFICVSANYFHT